jgi:chromosome segregation ATPase
MSQGEQTMLRYQYLMQATADAQGDFEKTSDGFANAQRRIQSSLESIKTSVGKLLIEPFANATAGIAEFLAKIAADMMPEKTVIDEFNEAHIDAEQKLADIQKTYDTASDLIKILKEIEQETVTLQDGTTISLSSLFGDLGEIEKSGGNIEEYIAGLGLDVEYVVLQYNKWKEATRQLTSTVPSLTSQINSETGAINGGTDALQKNLDEWKRNEENKVYWAEYYAKAEAVARAKGEQAGIQITARARQLAAERARTEMERLSKTPGLLEHDLSWYEDRPEWSKISGQRNSLTAEQKAYNDAVDNYIRLQGQADEAQKKAEESASDLADAESLLADELAATEEITGETLQTVQQVSAANEDAADSAKEWSKEQKAAGNVAVEAADSALKALADYIQGVRDSTAQAVNSVLKGFEKVNKAGDDLRGKSSELAGEEASALNKYSEVWSKWGSDNSSLKKMSENWDSLTDAEKEAYETLVKVRNAQKETNDALNEYKPEGMKAGLQSQIDFMTEYLDNLQKAQEMGLSADFLASLSDGSKESAEYLHNLVEAGPEAAQEVSNLYDEVQAQKKTFTDALADQKLAADQTYDALVQKAIEAIDELNLGAEAEVAMADTVGGLAQGIAEKVPEVQAAVDSIEEQLNRLSGFGFSFSIGGFNIEFLGSLFPHFKGGTDWVPRDNYPAFLDYGEAVLTAEENKIWQMFKNGQQPTSMDYDALGGVMRENVKAGGDVYLDGRTVGHVISDAQGRSYRALQRSGWQG